MPSLYYVNPRWTPPWESRYRDALTSLALLNGYSFVLVSTDSPKECLAELKKIRAKAGDIFWFLADVDFPEIINFRAKLCKKATVVAHNHGVLNNPYEIPHWHGKPTRYFHESATHVLFNSRYAYTSSGCPGNGRVVPFPVFDLTDSFFPEKKDFDIVIGARLEEDKSRLLAAKFVELYGHKFRIAVSWPYRKLKKDSEEFYKVEQLEKFFCASGAFVFPDVQGKEFHNLLLRSHALLSFPTIDTLNITGLEALFYRCAPIYPKMRPYTEVLPRRYLFDPYSLKDAAKKVELAVKTKIIVQINFRKYSVPEFKAKVAKILRLKNG